MPPLQARRRATWQPLLRRRPLAHACSRTKPRDPRAPRRAALSRRWCPEEQAGVLSKLFFFFANSLVRKGSQKHLEQSDLWDTAHEDEPQRLWSAFEQKLRSTASPTAPNVSAVTQGAAGCGRGLRVKEGHTLVCDESMCRANLKVIRVTRVCGGAGAPACDLGCRRVWSQPWSGPCVRPLLVCVQQPAAGHSSLQQLSRARSRMRAMSRACSHMHSSRHRLPPVSGCAGPPATHPTAP